MPHPITRVVILLATALVLTTPHLARAEASPRADAVSRSEGAVHSDAATQPESTMAELFTRATLREAVTTLRARHARAPDDALVEYALGTALFLRAIEQLTQDLYRYGLRSESPELPFVRLPVPDNPDPEVLTYEAWRAVLQRFTDNLASAAEVLGGVEDPTVKLRLPMGLIRVDFDGDGSAGPEERLWRLVTTVAWRAAKLSEEDKAFPIAFDAADAHWMIGYSHLLRALTELWLGHDTRAFHDYVGGVFFAGAPNPRIGLRAGPGAVGGFSAGRLADIIAAIHLISFDVTEPERVARVRTHLLEMISQSRASWTDIQAETDDDREWIPNAQQTSLTPLDVDAAQILGWQAFLDEAEAVLEGQSLLPHWRVDGLGINLRRVFEEPGTLDLVLWVHGAAALPYLERGRIVSERTARSLAAAFEGRFLAFAVWFQ